MVCGRVRVWGTRRRVGGAESAVCGTVPVGAQRTPLGTLGFDNPMETIKPKAPPTLGRTPLATAPAVPLPDPGQSYRPAPDAYAGLLGRLAAAELKRARADAERDRRLGLAATASQRTKVRPHRASDRLRPSQPYPRRGWGARQRVHDEQLLASVMADLDTGVPNADAPYNDAHADERGHGPPVRRRRRPPVPLLSSHVCMCASAPAPAWRGGDVRRAQVQAATAARGTGRRTRAGAAGGDRRPASAG
jgi:hypothetical protein